MIPKKVKKAVKARIMRSPPQIVMEIGCAVNPINDPSYICAEKDWPKTVNCKKTCFTQYWGIAYTTTPAMGKKEPDANIKVMRTITANSFAAWGVLARLAIITNFRNEEYFSFRSGAKKDCVKG